MTEGQYEFEPIWASYRRQVFLIAMRALRNHALAEDVCQETMLRVWRALPTFRGDCHIGGWIVRIAHREVARQIEKLQTERRHVDPAAQLADRPSLEKSGTDFGSSQNQEFSPALANEALRAGAISRDEHAVILARMQMEQSSWNDIGGQLKIDESTCASHHTRGVNRLRVFLFLHRQDSLGGRFGIERAFKWAQVGESKLTPDEETQFLTYVLGSGDPHKALRKPGLRSACAKIVRLIKH